MKNSRLSSLVILISIFFFWGFVAASNGILIPLFKEIFHLTQFKSQMVDLSFYIAYFVGSLIYFLATVFAEDPLQRIGYKKGLIIGLLISAVGAIGFIPAANMESYLMLLTCMFVIGLGFTLQQIVANPYVIALGDPSTGSHRLNLAGGVNSFGTTIGPVLLSLALFGQISSSYTPTADIQAVKMPSIVLCSMFILSALVLTFSNLPPITEQEKPERKPMALKFPQLTLGMLAIFFYVGVEVTIQSNLGALLKLPEIKGLSASQISPYISLYWGSLMIGRWRGSITVFNLSKTWRNIMMTVIPIVAFGVICGVNYLRTNDISDYKFYVPYILLAIVAFFISQEKPARTLILFSSLAACMMIVGLFTTGDVALFSFISGGLFCSVMWPCLFTLAIGGLGKYTTQGSSLLVMMILGGALIPPLQGKIVDNYGAHVSYWVPVFCFAYLAFYGWRVRHVYKKQGMDADAVVLAD
ncbi:MAG TPA: MFS transporter [Bacteroidia bacterium]|jgi:FHS family L-fucose permease-like MFS transporter|nr:MFS transporter [Bacteroidia bacterium]